MACSEWRKGTASDGFGQLQELNLCLGSPNSPRLRYHGKGVVDVIVITLGFVSPFHGNLTNTPLNSTRTIQCSRSVNLSCMYFLGEFQQGATTSSANLLLFGIRPESNPQAGPLLAPQPAHNNAQTKRPSWQSGFVQRQSVVHVPGPGSLPQPPPTRIHSHLQSHQPATNPPDSLSVSISNHIVFGICSVACTLVKFLH
jgi:hypothetical protein